MSGSDDRSRAIEIFEKKRLAISLLFQASLGPLTNYFDVTSEEMLDDKIRILQEYIDGKAPSEIEGFYSIFELLPPDGEIWD